PPFSYRAAAPRRRYPPRTRRSDDAMRLGQVSDAADHPPQRRRRDVLGANGHAPVQGAAFPRLTLSATLQPGNSDTVAPHGGKLLDDRHSGPAGTTPEEPPRGSARRLGFRVTHGERTEGADVAGELIRQSRGLGESVQQRADPGGKGATPD